MVLEGIRQLDQLLGVLVQTVAHDLVPVLQLGGDVLGAEVPGVLHALDVPDLVLGLQHEVGQQVELGAVGRVHVGQLVAQVVVDLGLLLHEGLARHQSGWMLVFLARAATWHHRGVLPWRTTVRVTACLAVLETAPWSHGLDMVEEPRLDLELLAVDHCPHLKHVSAELAQLVLNVASERTQLYVELLVADHHSHPLLGRDLVLLQKGLGPDQVTNPPRHLALQQVDLLGEHLGLVGLLVLVDASKERVRQLCLQLLVIHVIELLDVLFGLLDQGAHLQRGG